MKRPNEWDEREEELENQLNRGALWAITYGDLMSYLMIFFLLLYVATATRRPRRCSLTPIRARGAEA